jgi:hypothetical protein
MTIHLNETSLGGTEAKTAEVRPSEPWIKPEILDVSVREITDHGPTFVGRDGALTNS